MDAAHRRILWAVLAINAAMFLVDIGAGLAAGSASLQADALDFLGDAANYAVSLFVVGMALRYRATAALLKGGTMCLFGVWVAGTVIWHALHGTLPNAFAMGAVGFAALVANAASFGLLWAYRGGDANMRSAWICTRNDVLGNLAVLLAAAGVFGTKTDGLTLSSRQSWQHSRSKGRPPLSGKRFLNYTNRSPSPPSDGGASFERRLWGLRAGRPAKLLTFADFY
jgi:Co/Zn/Cd efflux system component